MVDNINKLTTDQFLGLFNNVVEYSPLVAQMTEESRPFLTTKCLINAIENALDSLDYKNRLEVLEKHPDLAGRLADQGLLTPESEREQKAAGLHFLTPEEKRQLKLMNDRYKEKFGFTFVICARENKAAAILSGLIFRLSNNKNEELETGLNEVKKIAALRAVDIVKCHATHPDPVSSHMLDTSLGQPARGVALTMYRMGEDGVWHKLATKETNGDGRASAFLSWQEFVPGLYKMHFASGHYFCSLGKPIFYPYIEVIFNIEDSTQHYHIAVLLNPFGYTTYRGS